MAVLCSGRNLSGILRRDVQGTTFLRSMAFSTAGSVFSQTPASKVESDDPVVIRERAPTVNEIVLNRSKKFNALDLDMVRRIRPHYDRWVSSGQPHTLIMHGTGDKAFCAGGDVASVRESALTDSKIVHDFFYEEYQLNHRIATAFDRSGLVQVSFWDGVTMGGGVGLSLHGKIRVATEKTLFAMPEIGIGLFPDVGGTYALSRLSGGPEIGMYLALSGARLGAADCMYAGLTTHYVPEATFDEVCREIAQVSSTPEAIDEVLKYFGKNAQPPAPKDAVMSLEARHEAIKKCFAKAESVHEILERLESMANDSSVHEDDRTWAGKSLKAIQNASPSSVCLSFEALTRHADEKVGIDDALINEYRLTQRICHPEGDFVEGVRAVLVDKDHSPKWKFSSVKDVPQDFIESHFEPLDPNHPRGELSLS